jgi:hypothetical protein
MFWISDESAIRAVPVEGADAKTDRASPLLARDLIAQFDAKWASLP